MRKRGGGDHAMRQTASAYSIRVIVCSRAAKRGGGHHHRPDAVLRLVAGSTPLALRLRETRLERNADDESGCAGDNASKTTGLLQQTMGPLQACAFTQRGAVADAPLYERGRRTNSHHERVSRSGR